MIQPSEISEGISEFLYNILSVFATTVINILTAPIEFIFMSTMPNYYQFRYFLQECLLRLTQFGIYLCDALMIEKGTILFLELVLTCFITVSLTSWVIKIVVKWWHYIVP